MNDKKIYNLVLVECYEEDAKPTTTVHPFATSELARKALKDIIKPRILSRMGMDDEDMATCIETDEGSSYFYTWSNCDGSYADADIFEQDIITDEFHENEEG